MRFAILLTLVVSAVHGQTCVPGRMLPTASLAGALDANSCLLTDGSAYQAYRLDLPVRGQMQIGLEPGASDLSLILRDPAGSAIGTGMAIRQPIEAGAYTLLVNARLAGEVGAYQLTSAFTPEAGMLCTSYPNIGLSQTVNGVLGASGCQSPGGVAYDAYTVATFGAGVLSVSVTSSGFTPTLVLRDTSSRPLASGAANLSWTVSADTTYQIAVMAGESQGAYQLTTTFQPSANSTCLARGTWSNAAQDAWTIGPASCLTTLEGSGDSLYYNYYFLSVPAAGMVNLTASSAEFNPTLVLLDSSGNTLITDAQGYDPITRRSSSGIRAQMDAGTYMVQLFSDVLSGGTYTMAYQFTAGGMQPCLSAGTPAGTLNAALANSGCRTDLGLSNLYSLTLEAPGTVAITMTTADFIPRLAIRDAKDNLVVMDEDQFRLGAAHISAELPAGTYSVIPAAISGAGRYQMTTSVSARDIPPCDIPHPLTLNGTYYEYLGASSCRGANGQPVDLYEFTLPTAGVIASVVASSDLDGYLTLTDESGNVIRSDDNTYGGGDPLIVQFLPAGTYRLAARAASATPGGPYALALYAALEPRPPFCTPRDTLAVGGSLKGNVNSAGCQYPDNTLADLYRVDLSADGSIDLRLSSDQFDAYLILLDANGNQVAQDDDGGGGTNARISKSLKAGTYYVVTKPFRDYFSQGDYTVSLSLL